MAILDRLFCEETSGDGAARIFPYFKERLDAIKEIRAMNEDMALMSNWGRKHVRKLNGRRIASIPLHTMFHWRKTYGFWPTQDMKLFHQWLNTAGQAWKT